MRKSVFSERQIIGILQQGEAGQLVKDICREHGISEGTLHRWKSKYGGLSVSDAERLKKLESENRRLKRVVTYMALDRLDASLGN